MQPDTQQDHPSDYAARAIALCRDAILRNKAFSLAYIAVALLRLLLAPAGRLVIYDDTEMYGVRAQASWWSLFHGYDQGQPFLRPWGYPLLMKLCRFDWTRPEATGSGLMRAQSLISVLALGIAALLGGMLFTRLAARLSWLGLFFAVSLSAFIYPWEPMALTEGVACNGIVLLLVMMFLLARPAWGMREALLTAGTATGVMFLKDANSFIGLIVLGLAGLDQLLVQRAPRAALTQLMARIRRSPRQLARSPLAVLALLLLAATVLKFRDLSQHKSIQQQNMTSFLLHRVLNSPPLYQAFVRSFNPPAALRTIPAPTEPTAEIRRFAAAYQQEHVKFLLSHPAPALKTFNWYSDDIASWAAPKNVEPLPKAKAYAHLYDYGEKGWPPTQSRRKMEFSRQIHRWLAAPVSWLVGGYAPWPFLFPLCLLAAASFLRLKLGPATLFLPLAFLAATFYTQHALAILFEGGENYRHALTGTFALILMPWLFAGGLAQWMASGVSARARCKQSSALPSPTPASAPPSRAGRRPAGAGRRDRSAGR